MTTEITSAPITDQEIHWGGHTMTLAAGNALVRLQTEAGYYGDLEIEYHQRKIEELKEYHKGHVYRWQGLDCIIIKEPVLLLPENNREGKPQVQYPIAVITIDQPRQTVIITHGDAQIIFYAKSHFKKTDMLSDLRHIIAYRNGVGDESISDEIMVNVITNLAIRLSLQNRVVERTISDTLFGSFYDRIKTQQGEAERPNPIRRFLDSMMDLFHSVEVMDPKTNFKLVELGKPNFDILPSAQDIQPEKDFGQQRHPEQQDDEVFMYNSDPTKPGGWSTIRVGDTAYKTSGDIIIPSDPDQVQLRPIFIKKSELENGVSSVDAGMKKVYQFAINKGRWPRLREAALSSKDHEEVALAISNAVDLHDMMGGELYQSITYDMVLKLRAHARAIGMKLSDRV